MTVNQRILIAALAAWTCVRADTESAQPQPTRELLACATLRNDPERLACYDRLASQLYSQAGGQGQPGVKSADAPQPTLAAHSAQDLFGAGSGGAQRPAPKPIERTVLQAITAHVVSLQPLPNGGVFMELDNGQAWQQTETTELLLKPGDPVKISRAAFGSFWLTAPSNRGTRVKRVR